MFLTVCSFKFLFYHVVVVGTKTWGNLIEKNLKGYVVYKFLHNFLLKIEKRSFDFHEELT